MKLLAAVLLAFVAGCSVEVAAPAPAAIAPAPAVYLPTAYTVGLDAATLSAGDVEGILGALGAWTTAVGLPLFKATISAGACASDVCISQGSQNITLNAAGDALVFGAGPAGECFGCSGAPGASIVLHGASNLLGPGMFGDVVMHELGHAMGLEHESGDNVMNATMQIVGGPSAADVKQFWTVRSVPVVGGPVVTRVE